MSTLPIFDISAQKDEVSANKYLDEAIPFGDSCLVWVYNLDPRPRLQKLLITVVTLTALVLLPWWPGFLPNIQPTTVSSPRDVLVETYSLLQDTAGISADKFNLIVSICLLGFAAMWFLDFSVATDSFWKKHQRIFGFYNTATYDGLFSEPRRTGRLISRMGNTTSNISYFLAGFIAIEGAGQTSSPNPFRYSDLIFGLMLIGLGVFSFIWHAGNPMKMHYPDLWTMESCILYLIIRFASAAIGHYAFGGGEGSTCTATLCFVLYTLIIIKTYKDRFMPDTFKPVGEGCMDYTAFWSVRYRMVFGYKQQEKETGSSSSGKKKKGGRVIPMTAYLTCSYAALPVTYLILPSLSMFAVGNSGSEFAAKMTIITLVLGWNYRMTERWAGDGNPIMNSLIGGGMNKKKQSLKDNTDDMSFFRVLLLAIFSPTAWLHLFTGLTLFYGYLWARSLDQQLFA